MTKIPDCRTIDCFTVDELLSELSKRFPAHIFCPDSPPAGSTNLNIAMKGDVIQLLGISAFIHKAVDKIWESTFERIESDGE